MMRLRMVAGAAAGLALLAAACGGGDTETDETREAATAQVTQPSTAGATTGSATATDLRSFTDATGKTLRVPQPPKRVVALSPSVVELLYAVGAPPIARPSSATFPEEAKTLPAVGTSYQPNFEGIAAQTPDFIIADAQIQGPEQVKDLERFGVPVFSIRVLTVDEVAGSLRLVGRLMGKAEEGERQAKALEGKIQAAQAKLPPPAERPSVFVMVGTAEAFWGAKPEAFAGDVVAKLGAKNVVQSGPDTTQFPGFTTYSLEQLAATDPDVILVISVIPNGPPTSRQLAGNPAWNGLRAVKNGRVLEVPGDILVQGAGPRVAQVLDQVFPVLYPGR